MSGPGRLVCRTYLPTPLPTVGRWMSGSAGPVLLQSVAKPTTPSLAVYAHLTASPECLTASSVLRRRTLNTCLTLSGGLHYRNCREPLWDADAALPPPLFQVSVGPEGPSWARKPHPLHGWLGMAGRGWFLGWSANKEPQQRQSSACFWNAVIDR